MVRSNQRSRVTYVSLACLALLLVFGVHEVRADDLDPQSLLGEWQGTGAMANLPSRTSPYYITIKKVEGGKVYGRSERPAAGSLAENNWDFVGTLAGNVITVKAKDFVMELTVNGKSMTGWSLSHGYRNDINLMHK